MNENIEAVRLADSLGSVTAIYHRVIEGESQATNELWEVYSKRLLGLARAVLRSHGIATAQVSEDSIVNVAFSRFFDALKQGRYQEVADRHELWCLLAVITRNRALNQIKQADRRTRDLTEDELAVELRPDGCPNPHEVAALCDTVARLENEIRAKSRSTPQAERTMTIFRMTLSGYTQREIAEKIGRAEVTVRRSLAVIRKLLSQQHLHEPNGVSNGGDG